MARITIKGISHEAGGAPDAPLPSVLREQLGPTGATTELPKPATAPERSPGGRRPAQRHVSEVLHG